MNEQNLYDAFRYRFDSPIPDLSSEDTTRLLGGIADEINDAMGTSYIHGRWVTATHSRSELYKLLCTLFVENRANIRSKLFLEGYDKLQLSIDLSRDLM